MKNSSAALILLSVFLVSCRTNSRSSAENLTETTAKIESTVSPTALVKPGSMPNSNGDINSKIGIVDVRGDGKSCLRTKRGDLAAGTSVSVIVSLDALAQKVLATTIDKKSEASCARRASETGDDNPGENFFYSLIGDGTDEGFEVGIGIIEPAKPVQIQNNLAVFDLNDDGKAEFFRRCAGSEGIHFTVWTGKPLKGKRIWHSFYYLDYDTQADCRKRDWEGTEN